MGTIIVMTLATIGSAALGLWGAVANARRADGDRLARTEAARKAGRWLEALDIQLGNK